MAGGPKDDPVVRAAADQLKAQACDWIKAADMFAAFTPTETDGEPGLAFMFAGPTGMLMEMHRILTMQLAKEAATEFLQAIDKEGVNRDVLGEYFKIDLWEGGEDDKTS